MINHDYDDIVNPIIRCEKAIRLNYRLFNDPDYCNDAWRDNIEILKSNSKWARDHLFNKILNACEDQVKKLA